MAQSAGVAHVIPIKPLGGKAYGHIPHLPGSRMGPGDHHCHSGQASIATLKKRDRYDFVSVTVKLDGSCVSVARIGNEIIPLGRAGFLAETSKYVQHQMFARWVSENAYRFRDALKDGERLVGEWLAQAHGTRYRLIHEPFVCFDLMVGSDRKPVEEMLFFAEKIALPVPFSLSATGDPLSIETATEAILTPRHGELDAVEGAVWRVERKGEFDFICKWVRPDKVDGRYLPEVSGSNPVWNWSPNESY